MPYPTRIPEIEWPARTPENIPDEILEQALRPVAYQACAACGEEQWLVRVPGHNTTHTCINCDTEHTVVG